MNRWRRTHKGYGVLLVREQPDRSFSIEVQFFDRGADSLREDHPGPLAAARLRADDMINPTHSCEESRCGPWQEETIKLS